MSLPSVTTGAASLNLDPKRQEAMDAPLIALAQMSGGDLRQILFAFFGFLHRRTDFYVVPNNADLEAGFPMKMGFREGDAEKLLIAAFRQFPLRRTPPHAARNRESNIGKPAPSQPKPMSPRDAKDIAIAAVSEQNDSKQTDPKQSAKVLATKREATTTSRSDDNEIAGKDDNSVRFTEEGKQIPQGNGGSTKRYTWTQTLDETSVFIGLPEGTKGKDLNVSLKSSFISVRMKKVLEGEDSPRVLVEGALSDKIRTDESIWSLEGGVLVLTLDKLKKTWWETVIVGDDKIDTSLVDSTRHIDTYGDSTQAAIRRIIFDQRQERLGLPKSDEIVGSKPDIPPLPSGVEYIDKSTLEQKNK